MTELKEQGIQTSIHYPSFKDFSFYAQYTQDKLENADEIAKRVLTLPLYPDLTEDMIDIVIDFLKKSLC